MTNKNSANNAKFNTVALTEQELVMFERETIVKLSAVVPIWYQQLGPGLDLAFAGLSLMMEAVDQAATVTESAGATDLEIRAAAVRALAANLAIPTLPLARTLKSKRLKALGGKQNAKSTIDYEARTIALLAGDFPAWYDEVGLGGFLRTLAKFVDTFAEVYLNRPGPARHP